MDAKTSQIAKGWFADLADPSDETSDRFARMERLYHEARLQTPDARVTFLAQACGTDDELRRDVESLLRQHDRAPGFLSSAINEQPALARGTFIGGYQILEQIGAGGMGEIYRAHDMKLGRDVAIKVLPVSFAQERERLTRFEREARVLASLNHPNIVTIYSIEETEGVLCLAMEYVEGNPLSDLIVKGALPLTTILHLTIPLADAVSAAHQKGITHRDLKPANVMVTADGRVKVLDFGLAKLVDASPIEVGVAGLATGPLTDEGGIVGTVAYMSPEQAEGKPIDHRSDIFSLGTLMYEMATGERPFSGETSLSVLSAILKETPRSVSDLNPAIPREFARVVRRCLAKEAVRRYQTAVDLRNDLEELRTELDSGAIRQAVESEIAGVEIADKTSRIHTPDAADVAKYDRNVRRVIEVASRDGWFVGSHRG